MTSVLVVGYGSIGKRHANVLAQSGYDVGVVSRRDLPIGNRFAAIAEGVAACSPALVVICTETAAHRADLQAIADCGYQGPVLVEKPLWQPGDPAFDVPGIRVSVAYVLRFHPVVLELRRLLAETRIFSAEIRCGGYLPDWRPDQDYRQTESAKVAKGGGVLRDLSHELDYAAWLFGDFNAVAAVGGHFSNLEIETDDVFSVLARTARCPAISLTLNYLDRPSERSARVNTDTGTFNADLLSSEIRLNGETVFSAPPFDRDRAFAEQHADALREKPSRLAGLADGIATIRGIRAIETAANSREWVTP